jgi:hypothetical protein
MDANPKYQVTAVQPEDAMFPFGKRFMVINVKDRNDRYYYYPQRCAICSDRNVPE